MDLSKLSDDDLMALKAGDLTKMSDAGLMQMKGATTEAKRPKWSDLPGNIPGSAKNFAGGIYEAVTSPLQTLKGLGDVAAGSLRNAMPAPIRSAIDSIDPNPAAGQAASGMASAVGQHYKDRYGSLEGARNALIADPVGVAGDVSTVFGAGGGLASAAGASKTANALAQASKFTNPLSAVAPVVSGTIKATGAVAKPVLGLATGTSAETVAQAFKAGKGGTKDFMQNLRGDVPMTDVLDRMKAGVQKMGQQKMAEYRSNMAAVTADNTVLDFAGIDKAISEAGNMATFKGQVKNQKAASAVQQMADEVAEWKRLDPKEFHTPEGLDALKQKIAGTLEGIPFEEKTARAAAGKIHAAIKSEIAKQAPVYSNTMKSYADASEQISEIERALSLGDKASKDTAMRKLQSLTRNNASTNYGNRLDMAKAVERQGGVDVQGALAGQAMNTWTPRSLSGQGAGLATMGGIAAGNPALLGLLPLQSPRAVGLGAYGLGRVGAGANKAARAITADDLAALGLAANQLNNLQGR